ncbi:MAG: acyltransferase [Oscillochloris sp.]|nr:acyltransferase [Oscillochloris sp.]
MRRLIFMLLFVAPPPLKPWILRVFCGAQIGRNVHIGWFATLKARRIALGDGSAIRALTIISCDGELSLGARAIISSFNLVYGSAGLRLGAHSYIGPQCLINCDEDITIGRYSALGARCMVYTHGSFLPYTEGYWVRFGPVTLGDYVWCAAGVFLNPGVSIGDQVFVNSRSVIAGTVPSGAVMEGNPATQTTSIDKLRRNVGPRRLDSLAGQMLKHFAEVGLERVQGIKSSVSSSGVDLRYRRNLYRIAIVPSKGDQPQIPPGTRAVFLNCRSDYTAPAGVPTLDLTTNRATTHGDPLAHELVVFFQRYYGVQLEP